MPSRARKRATKESSSSPAKQKKSGLAGDVPKRRGLEQACEHHEDLRVPDADKRLPFLGRGINSDA